MFAAIASFFNMFNQLFVGTTNLAEAYVNVTEVAKTKSERYVKEEQAKLLAPVVLEAEEPKQITA